MRVNAEAYALTVALLTAWLFYGRCSALTLASTRLYVDQASASDDEERLMVDVFRGYNSLIQPVKHLNDTPIVVKIALQLILLINVDEKDQVSGLGLRTLLTRTRSCTQTCGSL